MLSTLTIEINLNHVTFKKKLKTSFWKFGTPAYCDVTPYRNKR